MLVPEEKMNHLLGLVQHSANREFFGMRTLRALNIYEYHPRCLGQCTLLAQLLARVRICPHFPTLCAAMLLSIAFKQIRQKPRRAIPSGRPEPPEP